MTPADYRKAADLFEQVRQLPETQRASALDAACAGNQALRAEVLLLLQGDPDAEAGLRVLSPKPPLGGFTKAMDPG